MICLYKADYSIIPNRGILRFPNEVNSKTALAVVYEAHFSSPPSFNGKTLARILTGLVCARIEAYRQTLDKSAATSETAQQLRLYIAVLESALSDVSILPSPSFHSSVALCICYNAQSMHDDNLVQRRDRVFGTFYCKICLFLQSK